MQNCPRQLAMQSCVLCSFVRCGLSNQIEKKVESALTEVKRVNERIICAHFNTDGYCPLFAHRGQWHGLRTLFQPRKHHQLDVKAQRCTSHGRFQCAHWKRGCSVYLSWAYQQQRQVTAVLAEETNTVITNKKNSETTKQIVNIHLSHERNKYTDRLLSDQQQVEELCKECGSIQYFRQYWVWSPCSCSKTEA